MHNIKDLRNNIELYKKKLLERNCAFNLDELIVLDKQNRDLIQKKELLEQEKKNYQNLKILQILKNLNL